MKHATKNVVSVWDIVEGSGLSYRTAANVARASGCTVRPDGLIVDDEKYRIALPKLNAVARLKEDLKNHEERKRKRSAVR